MQPYPRAVLGSLFLEPIAQVVFCFALLGQRRDLGAASISY